MSGAASPGFVTCRLSYECQPPGVCQARSPGRCLPWAVLGLPAPASGDVENRCRKPCLGPAPAAAGKGSGRCTCSYGGNNYLLEGWGHRPRPWQPHQSSDLKGAVGSEG